MLIVGMSTSPIKSCDLPLKKFGDLDCVSEKKKVMMIFFRFATKSSAPEFC